MNRYDIKVETWGMLQLEATVWADSMACLEGALRRIHEEIEMDYPGDHAVFLVVIES